MRPGGMDLLELCDMDRQKITDFAAISESEGA
jgi:hypothetical protein